MKKLIATLLVLALAIPAMAADVSLVDGEIILTVGAGETVRGIAIVVEADEITEVGAADAIFNVFMDAAFVAESATPGSYALGDGNAIANPDAAGTITLPAAKISLCMGVLDESGAQGGAGEGTYSLGTIAACGPVTITADTLRGGIVGDNIVAGTIAGGEIICGGTVCVGDADGNGYIYTDDLAALVDYLVSFKDAGYFVMEGTEGWDAKMDIDQNGYVYTDDLSAMVDVLVGLKDAGYFQMCE